MSVEAAAYREFVAISRLNNAWELHNLTCVGAVNTPFSDSLLDMLCRAPPSGFSVLSGVGSCVAAEENNAEEGIL